MWVVSAPLFLRGDIKPAPGIVVEKITDDMLFSENSYSDLISKNYFLPFVTRVAKTFDGKETGNINHYRKYYDEDTQTFRSETGELALNSSRGVMQINAPKVQGVLGFLKGQTYDFPLFSTTVENTHASVIAVSRDNKPLTESKYFYLAVVGPSKMTGQQFKHSRTALKVIGSLPVLQQVVKGTVIFKNRTRKSKIKVLPLMTDGTAGTPMKVTATDKGMTLDLSKGRTYVYEVRVKKLK